MPFVDKIWYGLLQWTHDSARAYFTMICEHVDWFLGGKTRADIPEPSLALTHRLTHTQTDS